MASVDEILSIITCILFGIVLAGFSLRYMGSRWSIYVFIMVFIVIRIAAFGIRAYMDSGAIAPGDDGFLDIYITELVLLSVGVIFIMKLLARLYDCILPKLRAQNDTLPDLFERCLVERTRFFLLPLIALVIAGAVLSTPQHSASDQQLGLTLRKIGVSLLMLLGLWYWFAAFTYRNRYEGNRRAFTIALLATTLFDISLLYKLIYTFHPDAQSNAGVFFVFSPLMELIGLCILSVDLRAYFLGHPVAHEFVEIQPVATSPAGYGHH